MGVVREVHGVPIWLMQEYLIELGGQLHGEQQVAGEGWLASYQRIEDFKLGSIVIGRVRLEIEGDEQVLEALIAQLDKKLMRGGG